jgi:nicotinamidase-related amidase
MTIDETYPRDETALLLVDPYNDLLAEGGKLWPLAAAIATQVGLLDNLRRITAAAREARIPVFVVPHHRSEPDDFSAWRHATPYQLGAAKVQPFAKGTWGGEWHPDFAPRPGDVVVKEHWGSSGFANTDLDFRLKQAGASRLVFVGLLANTCIEGTARFAAELGYHVTLVTDATAAASPDRMHAAHVLNGPTFAHQIATTADVIAALPLRSDARASA